MSETRGLINSISNKWKLEQIPSKKLEIENKLMEEKLNQLKSELQNDKAKRSAQGGTIWSRGQAAAPVTNYGKSILKSEHRTIDDLNRLSNRQIKIKVLKDEALLAKNDLKSIFIKEGGSASAGTSASNSGATRRTKCGQCEKCIPFTHCLECCEDYCANCFTSFHMKGALRKHRTVPIGSQSATNSNRGIITTNRSATNDSPISGRPQNREFSTYFMPQDYKVAASPISSANSRRGDNSLLNGVYDEQAAAESFKDAVAEWRTGAKPPPVVAPRGARLPPTISNDNEHKDVSVGTESSQKVPTGADTARQCKHLEQKIVTNHTLSYAERMLLLKYRRNDLEIEYRPSSVMESDNGDLNTQTNGHISFESLMNVLEVNGNERTDLLRKSPRTNTIEISIEDTKYSTLNPEMLKQNSKVYFECKTRPLETDLLVESLDIDLTSARSEKPSNLRCNSVAGLKSATNRPQSGRKRPQTSRPEKTPTKEQTKTPKSARVTSARLANMPSNISRVVSDQLKAVSLRPNANVAIDADNSIANFLLMNVAAAKDKDEPKAKTNPLQNFKISNQFFENVPRTWRPMSILEPERVAEKEQSANNKPTVIAKDVKKIDTPAPSLSHASPREITKTPTPKPKVIAAESAIMSPKRETRTQVARATPITKEVPKAIPSKTPSKSARNRTTNSVTFDTKQTRNPPRAASALPKCSSKLSYNFDDESIQYDNDDGRSSKLCQNEDDDNYFGELENEFMKTTGSRLKSSDLAAAMLAHQGVLDIDELTKNLNGLELSLRNVGYDSNEDDLESMTLEELRSLR